MHGQNHIKIIKQYSATKSVA